MVRPVEIFVQSDAIFLTVPTVLYRNNVFLHTQAIHFSPSCSFPHTFGSPSPAKRVTECFPFPRIRVVCWSYGRLVYNASIDLLVATYSSVCFRSSIFRLKPDECTGVVAIFEIWIFLGWIGWRFFRDGEFSGFSVDIRISIKTSTRRPPPHLSRKY